MRFYQATLLLILFSLLLFTAGCGMDNVEESEADILDPVSTDFHFQDFPLAGGSLIRPEDVPVVTIEKTREDGEFFYWQLKADPAPIHEDLVVGVVLVPQTLVFLENVRTLGDSFWDRGLALEDQEVTLQLGPREIGLSSPGNQWRWDPNPGIWDPNLKWDPIVVVIPKLQNTSQEFKLPLSVVLADRKNPYSGFIEANELPELPPLKWNAGAAEAAEARIRVEGTPAVDGPSMMRYYLSVADYYTTATFIGNNPFLLHNELAGALMDMPIFRTTDGYIIREGFAFSYYYVDWDKNELEIPPEE